MGIKSIEKAIDILNCFSFDNTNVSVGQISKITGISKSTVSRILATFESKGCVEKTGKYGVYKLSVKFYIWGNIVYQNTNISSVVIPIMTELRDKCGEEVSLYIVQGEARVCLERVSSKYEVAKVSTMGISLPLHCGASGKVLLAHLPEALRKKIITSGPLKKYTPFTITDPDQLENSLEQIRKQGYAVSTNEREIGAYSVVAPIWDSSNKVVASLAISGPTFRLSERQLQENIKDVILAAKKISEKLGNTKMQIRGDS